MNKENLSVLAFDFGASSGRAMLATLTNGKIILEEVHRFENKPITIDGTLCWDIDTLFAQVKQGIKNARAKGNFSSIGIDTWGVDFGMIDSSGDLIFPPVHYRDSRTVGIPEKVWETISRQELYLKTGIQCMPFNTLYQLYYLANNKADLLKKCSKILLTADLFAYLLTGEMRSETTLASTTNFLNPHTKQWDTALLDKLSIPTSILPPIIAAGEKYGKVKKELAAELGIDEVSVVAVCTHDTASAVVSIPSVKGDFVYISCGTWSLFGTELTAPIINEQSNSADVTNETGINNTTRFLKNIMGLWIIQESRREWNRQGQEVTFNMLEQEALGAIPFRCFIDPDDQRFAAPGDIPARIVEYCRETNQYVPQNRGEIMICIYQSLAMKYRVTFEQLKTITGKNYQAIHMVGGGIKDKFLCQLTASACNITVVSGPVEATVTGNTAVQLMALGEISDLKSAREIIKNSTECVEYYPQNVIEWQEAFKRY